MNLIVSVHLRQGSDEAARRLAAAAGECAASLPLTRWVDESRTVFRCQFALAPAHEEDSLAALVAHFQRAAGEDATQVIVLVSTPVDRPPAETSPTLVVKPVPRPVTTEPLTRPAAIAPVHAPATTTEPLAQPPLPARLFAPLDESEPTHVHVPLVAPLTSPRQRASETEAPLVELAVHACEADGLRGIVLATGQALSLQVSGIWDVVEGEILTFRPTRFWRFARNSLASGVYQSARLEPSLFAGRPLALRRRPDGFELELPSLEGDPSDPADDPMADARAALQQGRIADARHLARTALDDNIRCLEAHELLSRTCLARGDNHQAIRHDAALLAYATEALPRDFSGTLARTSAGNAPVFAAVDRLRRLNDPRARALVSEWSPRLGA